MTSKSRKSFISSYCAHHNLDTIPSPWIHPLTNTHTSAAECDKDHLLHTKSLQLPDNKGLQTFCKTVESIIIMPSASFEKQIEEHNKEIVLKKLSMEIILGKTTEDTAMTLDAGGGASFEQLQDLIKKECEKQDKKYRSLEHKYNKLQESFENLQSQKNYKQGASMAPRTKRNRHPQIVERFQTNAADRHQSDGHKRNIPDHYPDAKEKSTVPTTTPQTTIPEN